MRFCLFPLLWITLAFAPGASAAGADDLRQFAQETLIDLGLDSESLHARNFAGHLSQDQRFAELARAGQYYEAELYAQKLLVDGTIESMRAGSAGPDALLVLHELLLRGEARNPPPVPKRKWWKPSTWTRKEPISELRQEVRTHLQEKLLVNPAAFGGVPDARLLEIYPLERLRKDLKRMKPAERMKFYAGIFDGDAFQPLLAGEYELHLQRLFRDPIRYGDDLIEGVRATRKWPSPMVVKYSSAIETLQADSARGSKPAKAVLRQLEPVLQPLPYSIKVPLKYGRPNVHDDPRKVFLRETPTMRQLLDPDSAFLREHMLWYLDDLTKNPSRLFMDVNGKQLYDLVADPQFLELFPTAAERRKFAQSMLALIPKFQKEGIESHRQFARILTDLYPQAFDYRTEAKAARQAGEELIAYLGTNSNARKASPVFFDELRFQVQKQIAGKLGETVGPYKPLTFQDLPSASHDRAADPLKAGDLKKCDLQKLLQTFVAHPN